MISSQLAIYKIIVKYPLRIKESLKAKKLYVIIALAILNLPLLLIYGAPYFFYYSDAARKFIMWPYYAYQTFSLTIFVVVLVALPMKGIAKLLKRFLPISKQRHVLTSIDGKSNSDRLIIDSRRSFIRATTLGLSAYAFFGSLDSIYNRDDYEIENVKLRVTNLPPQLEGTRIAMVSDIHSGMYMIEHDMLKYVEAINDLRPDLIFIPGDFVTNKTEEIYPFINAFSKLRSNYGTFTCLGNHEYFADPEIITAKMRESGMKVLRNDTEELEINGARLMLSGVDDGRHANFDKVSYEATSLNTTRILLCHKPYYFDRAVAGKFDIMLSGHTHGGQIVLVDVLGFKLTPAAFASPYISGFYKRGGSLLYVSRGIGTIGLPIRVNCPPEITLFTLTGASH
jgi:predicted MPP superfamily phosphohydrolase